MFSKSAKQAIIVLLLALIVVPLVGFGGRAPWGDPSGRVWYYGKLVPFGTLLEKGLVPHCHDGLGSGVLTCYDTNEELSAAIGVDLPGVDEAAVERLRATGAVAPAGTSFYSIVYEHVDFGGRNVALGADCDDFGKIFFDNITSSIQVLDGAGYSTYFMEPGYGQPSWLLDRSVADLRTAGCNDVISSARRGWY